MGFAVFDWVLSGFYWFFLPCFHSWYWLYLVSKTFIDFDCILLGLTGFDRVSVGFYWVFTMFRWVVLVVPGLNDFC